MRRRQRHFNPGSAGASIAFDSRFVTGLNNNDAVTTWSDRTINGNNATGSGTTRPTYQTAQQGGNAVIRFDGTDDRLVCASYVSLTASSIIAAAKSSITTGNDRTVLYFGNADNYSPFYNWIGLCKSYTGAKWVSGNYNAGTERSVTSTAAFTTSPVIVTGITNDASTNRLFVDGVANGTATSTTVSINSGARPTLGRRGADLGVDAYHWNGDIYSVSLFPSAVSGSLRKRLEQSAAYSFKIACS